MSEQRVWIAQCLCPDRHAILAAAGEATTEGEAGQHVLKPLQGQVTALLKAGVLNPWCGMCNAPAEKWTYEIARTRFATLAEANPTLAIEEAKQGITRTLFGDLHKGTKQ